MEFPRDSELVYGADMCNRRLRGVKVNPIYQEKDAAGSSEVDPSIPVGEIQIDMYESLPRKRRILKYSPDAILLTSTNKDGHTVIEWKYPTDTNCGSDGGGGSSALQNNNSPQKSNNSNASGTGVSGSDCVNDGDKNSNAQQQKSSSSGSSSASSHLWEKSSLPTDMIHNNLNTTTNINIPIDDDGDALSSGGDSGGSKDTNIVRDDTSSIRECSPIQEQDEDSNGSSDSNKGNSDKALTTSTNEEEESKLQKVPSSTDAIVAYAVVEQSNPRNIYSVNDFSGELSDMEFSLKHSNKFLNDLDYITSRSIPVCHPIDVLNNNQETVPDQMVSIIHTTMQSSDDIASIKALQLQQHSLSSNNSIDNQSPHKNGVKLDKNGNGCKSNTSDCACKGRPSLKCPCGRLALQKLLKQKYFLTKSDNSNSNDSLTRNRFKEVVITSNSKRRDGEKSTNESTKSHNEESVLRELSDSLENELNESSSVDHPENHQIVDVDLGEDTNVSKSILISKRRGSKIKECRGIKFAADTIFNEFKSKTKYAKERRRPVEVVSDNDIHLDDLSKSGILGGYDNPVFVCDEDIPDSVFLDETSFSTIIDTNNIINNGGNNNNTGGWKNGKAGTKKSKKNKQQEICVTQLQDGSIILKPGDLNVPAYLEEYIRSFNDNNNNDVNDDGKKKAPPVSIEALGGMTVADLADIEVAKDDGDYWRRRRKKNAYGYYDEGSAFLRKEQRIKNIKISVIVFVVFAVICTAIGLGIHYGGNANSTSTAGLGTDGDTILDRSGASIGGFAGGIF